MATTKRVSKQKQLSYGDSKLPPTVPSKLDLVFHGGRIVSDGITSTVRQVIEVNDLGIRSNYYSPMRDLNLAHKIEVQDYEYIFHGGLTQQNGFKRDALVFYFLTDEEAKKAGTLFTSRLNVSFMSPNGEILNFFVNGGKNG
jgi:hypothetical protein